MIFEGKVNCFVFFAKVLLKALYDRNTRVLVGLRRFLASTPVHSTRHPDHKEYGVMRG